MFGRLFKKAAEAEPAETATELVARGQTRLQVGDLVGATALFERARDLAGGNANVLANLGNCLAQQGMIDEAMPLLRRAREIDPRQSLALLSLGNIAFVQGRFADVIEAHTLFLETNPGQVAVRRNLIFSFNQLGLWTEAAPYIQSWLADAPEDADACFSRASMQFALNDMVALGQDLDRSLSLRPGYLDSLYLRSYFNILSGNLAGGWQDYEVRIPLKMGNRIPPYPRWTGNPMDAGTLLMTTEQGMGDAFMFARFLPEILARAIDVVLYCPPVLTELFSSSFPGLRVVATGSELRLAPPVQWLPMMSAAHVLQCNCLDDLAMSAPYLIAPKPALERLEPNVPVSGNARIGLVWVGNPDRPDFRIRALPESTLEHVIDMPGVDWYSLQIGELVPLQLGGRIRDLTPGLKNFADTAAAIANLDAVVSIDTSVAHLSGAMDKPTFVLEPYTNDWRWRIASTASPWYPSVRLFKAGLDPSTRWDGAVAELGAVLRNFAARRP
jgi:tetratricopeptide (TPR) repeat protein